MNRFTRRVVVGFMTVALIMGVLGAQAEVPGVFTTTEGFATKTGFRGVFSWQATQPVKALVHYGTDPTNLSSTVDPLPGAPDTAGLAIANNLTPGSTYYWYVEDLVTRDTTPVQSFIANNAYTDWDGSTYTLDLLVALDTDSLPPEIPHDQALEDISQGISIFAERLYDAMDGYARLGNVIVTDTNLEYAANLPGAAPLSACAQGNYSDVLIQTSVPFDSHTWGYSDGSYAIDKPCVSFYVGRLGQLIVPWEDDLHFGYVATHEMMHYAFGAPDLYDLADVNNPRVSGCWNLEWDGSLMHNSGGWKGSAWELTELDRNQTVTPCDHQHDDEWTWEGLRTKYTNVPAAPTTGAVGTGIDHIIDDMARGNADGGALDIKILNRTPGSSTLTSFTPDDTDEVDPNQAVLDCSNADGPVTTDPEGDATDLYLRGFGPNETALDLASGSLAWGSSEGKGKSGNKGKGNGKGKGQGKQGPSVPPETLLFEIGVWGLDETNPESAPNISYNFYFNYDGSQYAVEAFRDAGGTEQFKLSEVVDASATSARLHIADLTGGFDAAQDSISILLPNSTLTELGIKPFASGDELSGIEILSRRGVSAEATTTGPSADSTENSCNYTIGGGTTPIPPPPPPPIPTADGTIAVGSEEYTWSAGPFFRVEGAVNGIVAGDACSGSGTDHCDHTYLQVQVPEGGATLNVTVSTDDPTADFDLYVFGPDGKEVGNSAHEFTPPESISKAVLVPGLYTVAVNPWVVVGASYTGTASLTPPKPPVETPFDGEISVGGSVYEWEGDPLVDVNPGFFCTGAGELLCDVERIKVNVPATGGTISVAVNSAGGVFRFEVYDPSGNRIILADGGGTSPPATAQVTETGVYVVAVRASLAPLEKYFGKASIS